MKKEKEKEDLMPLLTDEQKRLAQAKEKLTESLNEIHNETDTIYTYLSKVNTEKQVDFINDLVPAQHKLDEYLGEAEESLKKYSTIRTELISFADKEDIFFIPRLLNKVKNDVNGILPILKQCQHEVLSGNINISEEDMGNVVFLHAFFTYYQKRVYKMEEVYQDLREEIYQCDKEAYGKRLDKQYVKTHYLFDSKKMFDKLVLSMKELFFEEEMESRAIVIEDNKKGITKENDVVKITSNLHVNIGAIEKCQARATEVIKRIAPDLQLKEFTDRDSLAWYIHNKQMLHEDANELLKGYVQLNWLEDFKKEILGLLKPKQKRGRKKCASFNDIDKRMLAEMYRQVYESEKKNICRGSGNACAGLFLIAMYRGVAERACEKVAAFCQLMRDAVVGIKIDTRTVQEVINSYRCECNRVRYRISEHIQKYMDIVARIIRKLEGTGLILE